MDILGVPLILALVIIVVGLLLIRTAFTLVKVALLVGLGLAIWLGGSWLWENYIAS